MLCETHTNGLNPSSGDVRQDEKYFQSDQQEENECLYGVGVCNIRFVILLVILGIVKMMILFSTGIIGQNDDPLNDTRWDDTEMNVWDLQEWWSWWLEWMWYKMGRKCYFLFSFSPKSDEKRENLQISHLFCSDLSSLLNLKMRRERETRVSCLLLLVFSSQDQ